VASRPLYIAIVISAVITALRLRETVASDVAWQLWIAGRINAGAHLYSDIVETNPPLWFWLALPVERIASILHLRVEAALVLLVGVLVSTSLAATDRLLTSLPPKRRALLLGYSALTLTLMPWIHFGQREHIVLIGSVPYAALIAARREAKDVSPALAALIGTGAALGFFLKHYFLIVPVLLELWLIAGGRRRGLLRPETIAIVAVALAYGAAIFLLAPEFLTKIVPMLRLAYGDFGPHSLRYLFGPFALAGLVTLGFMTGHARQLTGGKAPFAAALLVEAIGFASAYFIQFKGWPYHAVPLIGAASIALAAALVELAAVPISIRLFAPALLLAPLALSTGKSSGILAPNPDLARAVSGLPQGTPVGFIAENSAVAWSVTLQHQFRYPSRYNGFWMLSAVLRNEREGNRDPHLAELGRRIVSETVADLRCMPPSRIIVARPQPGSWNEHTLDPLPLFQRNPEFAELLSHYRVVSRTTVEVYAMASPLAPTDPVKCRLAA
jgi:hypothetical protein